MATAPPANVCTALDAAFTGAVCIIAGAIVAAIATDNVAAVSFLFILSTFQMI